MHVLWKWKLLKILLVMQNCVTNVQAFRFLSSGTPSSDVLIFDTVWSHSLTKPRIFLDLHGSGGCWHTYRCKYLMCFRGHAAFFFFFTIFIREKTLEASCLHPCIPRPFYKGVYSKRKEFAFPWDQILSFSSRPFFRGEEKQLWQSCLP